MCLQWKQSRPNIDALELQNENKTRRSFSYNKNGSRFKMLQLVEIKD